MKILKLFLFAIVGIILLMLITALFIKKEYHVEQEVNVNKPKQEVFDYIKFLKNQANFSKWEKMDPNMKREFRGNDGTVGFVSAWDSDKKDVGKGEQEIAKITEGERIDFNLHFIKPFDDRATAYMATEALTENETKVKWGIEGKMNYPMNLMLLFMDMNKMIGDDLKIGLNNLKVVLEK